VSKRALFITSISLISGVVGVALYGYATIINPALPFTSVLRPITSSISSTILLAPIKSKDPSEVAQQEKHAAKEEAVKEAKQEAKQQELNTCEVIGGGTMTSSGCSGGDQAAIAAYVPTAPATTDTVKVANGGCSVNGIVIPDKSSAIGPGDALVTCNNGQFDPADITKVTPDKLILPSYIPRDNNGIIDTKGLNETLTKTLQETNVVTQTAINTTATAVQAQNSKENDLFSIISPNIIDTSKPLPMDPSNIATFNADQLTKLRATEQYKALDKACRDPIIKSSGSNMDILCSWPAIQSKAIEALLPELLKKLASATDATYKEQLNTEIASLQKFQKDLDTQVKQQVDQANAAALLSFAERTINHGEGVSKNENIAEDQQTKYATLIKDLSPTELAKSGNPYQTKIALQSGDTKTIAELIQPAIEKKEAAIKLQNAYNFITQPTANDTSGKSSPNDTITTYAIQARQTLKNYDKANGTTLLIDAITSSYEASRKYFSEEMALCKSSCLGACIIDANASATCQPTTFIGQGVSQNGSQVGITVPVSNPTDPNIIALVDVISTVSKASGGSISLDELNKIISFNQILNPDLTASSIEQAINRNNYLCPSGNCVYSDKSNSFIPVDIADGSFVNYFNKLSASATEINIRTLTGLYIHLAGTTARKLAISMSPVARSAGMGQPLTAPTAFFLAKKALAFQTQLRPS